MRGDPARFLPLTPIAFEILVSVAGEARHGYAMLRDMGPRLEPAPNAGTLYRALARLVDAGLIRELEAAPEEEDARRRYYMLTSLGRAVLEAETARLEAAVARARGHDAQPRPRTV